MSNLLNVNETHPYYELAKVFEAAFLQASAGKGSERHAYSSAEKYSMQLICEMDRRLNGNASGPRYQAVKKIYESARMEPIAAIKELLGAINYISAAVILLNEYQQDSKNISHIDHNQKESKTDLDLTQFHKILFNETSPSENTKNKCESCTLHSTESKSDIHDFEELFAEDCELGCQKEN